VATIRKYRGKWEAQVRRKGFKTLSQTFETKGAASAWAKEVERELDFSNHPDDVSVLRQMTLGDLLERYRDTVTPQKKSRVQETYRLNFLLRQLLAQLSLDGLTTGVFARYRDDRLQQVGPQQVIHELNALSVVLRTAKLDWDIPLPKIPLDDLRKPRMPPGRNRRLREGEFERLREAAFYGNLPYVWPVIEFALETAMRKAEILGLEWQHIHWRERFAHLPETKNGLSRDVPLTERALAILLQQRNNQLPRPFPHSVPAIRHAWTSVTIKANITNLHFHDLRHEAISRFFEIGLSVPEVAQISGHKDFRMLARYTHMDAKKVASVLKQKTVLYGEIGNP